MIFEADEVPRELLPRPAGWRILIAPVKVEEKSKGGIVFIDESKKSLEYFRHIAKVVAIGSECYKHEKFNGGISIDVREPIAWCKVGDIIQYSTYTGADITIQYNGELHKLKILNDDEIISVFDDPSVLMFL